ncbi:MAG: hypothetical protein A2Y56_13230 [Candidatus Aminicenantes bacterium RBG_13_63_10]|nr:MAG: hypothetical protein A2Y56_13230 [Candidatus Aminicenantes bacterium RBG_13_63_10]
MNNPHPLKAIVCVLALLAASCAAPRRGGPGGPSSELRLHFLGDFNIPTGARFNDLDPSMFGGLSSLSYEPASGTILALSDAKADYRLYRLSITVSPGRLEVRPRGVFFLRDADGNPFPAAALDPEGLAPAPDGSLYISSERHGLGKTVPGLFRFSAAGELLRILSVPEKFLPSEEGEGLRGTRPNASFEALALAPDEPRLFTAAENALYQDGGPSGPDKGSLVRILEIDVSAGGDEAPAAEFAYPLDEMAVPDGSGPGRGDIGLVEILALGGREFLSLERSYFIEDAGPRPRRSRTRIRIYRFSLDGAEDIRDVPSLKESGPVRPVRKELVLDFGGIVGRLTPGFRSLDNFEAMGFGPVLENGNRTLLLVSDNNFSPTQRTVFLAFEVIPR